MTWKKLERKAEDNWNRIRSIIESLGYEVPRNGITTARARPTPNAERLRRKRRGAKTLIANYRTADLLSGARTTDGAINARERKARREASIGATTVADQWAQVLQFRATMLKLDDWVYRYGVPLEEIVTELCQYWRKRKAIKPSARNLGIQASALAGPVSERQIARLAARRGIGKLGTAERAQADTGTRLGAMAVTVASPEPTIQNNPIAAIDAGLDASEVVQRYSRTTAKAYRQMKALAERGVLPYRVEQQERNDD